MSRLSPRSSHASAGFTLLELLVAMAIFAIVGALALGGLNTVLTQQDIARRELAELAKIQRAMRLVMGDFSQINPRWVRDPFLGDSAEAPLVGPGRGDFIVRMTRDGWPNPYGIQARGTLQRVQYRLEDRKLLREYWPMPDTTLATQPRSETLLEGVESLKIEYCGQAQQDASSDQCIEQWPPADLAKDGAIGNPRAIRLILEIDGWGTIERLAEVPL
jgi:general secretion pathway protein J